MNVGNKSVESIGVLANKTSGEPSIQNNNTHEVRRNIHPSFIGFERLNPIHSGEGKKHFTQNPYLPLCSGGSAPSSALFATSSTTLNGFGSLHQTRLHKQPLNNAKESPPSTNQTFLVVSCSKSDRDETLAIMLAKQFACQLNHSTKTLNRKL